MLRLHRTSRLFFRELTLRKDASSWIIGRTETGDFIRTSPEGKAVYQDALKGLTVGELEAKHKGVDVRLFLYELLHEGFVQRVDNRKIHDHRSERFSPLLNNVKQDQVAWLFHPILLTLYAAVLVFGLYLLATHPDYLPVPGDMFFTDNLTLLLLVSFFVGWILVFVHEFGHYLAAKSYGLLTRFGITHRFYYVVAITDVTNVYTLPRNKRFRVFFAGMIVDALIMCGALIGIWFNICVPFLSFLVLIQFLGLVWQLLVFLRTDLYFVIENILDVHNLHDKTLVLITNPFRRIKKEISYDTPHEHAILWLYTLAYVLGIGALTLLVVVYSLPITLQLLRQVFGQLFLFDQPARFYDAVVFLLVTLTNYVILVTVTIHKKLHRSPLLKLLALTLLLLGEFIVMFLMLATGVMLATQYSFVFAVLAGLLFPVPVYLLWRNAKPDSALAKEFAFIVASITLFYLVVLWRLVEKFVALAHVAVGVPALIGCFLGGCIVFFAFAAFKGSSRSSPR